MTELPLNARVTAPETVLPSTPGVEWRPASEADIDGMLDCARAIDAVDHPHFSTPRDELEDEFDASYVDAARDTIVAIDPDGVVQAWGFATLSPGQDTLVRSILWGGVRPTARGKGLGRALLEWQNARAVQQLASSSKSLPGWVIAYADEPNASMIRLFQRFDFEIKRYYLELRRDLAEPIAERPLVDGLTLVPFLAEHDEATRLARNDSFRDHWGSQPVLEESWGKFVGGRLLRRDLSFLAVADDGEVAGFVITTVNEEDWEGQGFSSGYIDLVGVRRAWRGKAIAPSLLSAAMVAMREAELDKAVLDVDAANPSGALGLYEGVGFRESNRSVNLLKEF